MGTVEGEYESVFGHLYYTDRGNNVASYAG